MFNTLSRPYQRLTEKKGLSELKLGRMSPRCIKINQKWDTSFVGGCQFSEKSAIIIKCDHTSHFLLYYASAVTW